MWSPISDQWSERRAFIFCILFVLGKHTLDTDHWLIMSMGRDVSELRPPIVLLFILRVIWEHGEPWWWWWWWLGKTSDSSTRGLCQSYQQRHLGANMRNGWRRENFVYQYLRYINGSLTCHKFLRHGPPALLPIWRKVCCGFLSPLKIYHLGQVWIHDS
jgi:hypothetical protein